MSNYYSDVSFSGNSQASASRTSSITSASAMILNEIEASIIRSINPIEINETSQITVHGQTGIWCNKHQCQNWNGELKLSEYEIFQDPDPQFIHKKPTEQLVYIQELAIRYLRPPTPPNPGEIIITQEADHVTTPAPPIIIRQEPDRIPTPEPLVIREMPPRPPRNIETKRITISGKRVPPPRKVIIERLPSEPVKPQSVIIERWLPYKQNRRRVVFNKLTDGLEEKNQIKNLVIEWEAPEILVKKVVKYLGVVRTSPDEYIQSFGDSLQKSSSLPEFVYEIETPSTVGKLAADVEPKSAVHELDGDLEGFRYIDMDKEGLSEYRQQLRDLGICDLIERQSLASSYGLKA